MSRKHRRKKKHKPQGSAPQGAQGRVAPQQGNPPPVPPPSGRQECQRDAGATPGAAPDSRISEAALAEVERLTAAGHHKAAVERAKALHKELASKASERVLVEAYAGRIREMLDAGMTPEAAALTQLVRERFPALAGRLDATRSELLARGGDLGTLVRPLADPSLTPEKRAEIEETLRRILTDPGELLSCNALPPEHALRKGAQVVLAAFEAVTHGPATDEAIALPEIPRRGPLASWKWLVRAIAFFYRRDDEACRKCIEAIEPDSAVARLVPVLRMLVDAPGTAKLLVRQRELANQVAANAAPLKQALVELDAAMGHKGNRHRTLEAIRQAVAECRRVHPAAVDALRQRIAVRGYLRGLRAEEVVRAIGGSSLHDAEFWRLLARAAETAGGPATACGYWEEFRKHAVHQGWFPAEGVEAAALFRRMLRLLDQSLPEELAEVRRIVLGQPDWLTSYYDPSQPPSVLAAQSTRLAAPADYFLSPGFLYPLVCRLDPDPKVFEDWVGWAEETGGVKEAEAAALRWGEAFPQAAKPFLYLADACEKRDALKRALGFLSEAESRDPLNPEVRRARLRLLAATAMRHLKQSKPHLLAKDCAELDALPQAKEGDRPAFVAALRSIMALLEQNRPEADRWRDEACRTLGAGGHFLLAGLHGQIAEAAPEPNFLREPPAEADGAQLIETVARVCSLGEDLGMPFYLIASWGERIGAALKPEACALDAGPLRSLIEAALRAEALELAYRLSGIGLARGGPGVARFLLLRARSIPSWHGERRMLCFEAVKTLAQRQRDTELLGEALDLSRGRTRPRRMFWLDLLPEPEHPPMSATEAQEVVARETQAAEYPASVWDVGKDEALGATEPDWAGDDEDLDEDFEEDQEPCQCPDCRRRRREEGRKAGEKTPLLFDTEPYTVEQQDEIKEDFLDEDETLEEDEILPGLKLPKLPPAVLKMMLKEFRRAAERGEEPDFDRLVAKMLNLSGEEAVDPGFRNPRRRRRRR